MKTLLKGTAVAALLCMQNFPAMAICPNDCTGSFTPAGEVIIPGDGPSNAVSASDSGQGTCYISCVGGGGLASIDVPNDVSDPNAYCATLGENLEDYYDEQDGCGESLSGSNGGGTTGSGGRTGGGSGGIGF